MEYIQESYSTGIKGLDFIDSLYAPFFEGIGFSLDKTKGILTLFLTILFSFFFRFLPKNKVFKQIIIFVTGIFFCFFVFREQTLHFFLTSMISYILLGLLPRTWGYLVVNVFAWGYLMWVHLYRYLYDYMSWRVDWSGIQMLLIIKITQVSFAYHDAIRDPATLNSYEKAHMVHKFPKILDFFSYCFFFPGLLCGPVFEYKEIVDFIDGSMFKQCPNGKAPFPLKKIMLLWLRFLFFLAIYTVSLYGEWNFFNMERFKELSFWRRNFFLSYTGLGIRLVYHTGWVLGEIASLTIGIGFSGYNDITGKPKFSRQKNSFFLNTEVGKSLKDVTTLWNMKVQNWLKNYCYKRVINFGRPFALFLTFAASALWHGFYPGYFVGFLTSALFLEVAAMWRLKMRPRIVPEGCSKARALAYNIFTRIITNMAVNYALTTSFVTLSWERSYFVLKTLYFHLHIEAVLLLLLLAFVPLPRKEETTKRA